MPPAPSAGLLLYRRRAGQLEILLGHLGGPYFARKDDGAWSIPKGEYGPDEEPLAAARREFTEETGVVPPTDPYLPLGTVRQRNGKQVTAWAVEADLDPGTAVSNTFEIEWPPRSGRRQAFPEIDRVAWFAPDAARPKMLAGQAALIDRLLDALD